MAQQSAILLGIRTTAIYGDVNGAKPASTCRPALQGQRRPSPDAHRSRDGPFRTSPTPTATRPTATRPTAAREPARSNWKTAGLLLNLAPIGALSWHALSFDLHHPARTLNDRAHVA